MYPGSFSLHSPHFYFWKLFDKKRAATMQPCYQLWASLPDKPGPSIFIGKAQAHFTCYFLIVPFTEKQRAPTFRHAGA
jgi:hypothetical protein